MPRRRHIPSAHDEEAFQRLVRDNADRLYRVAYSVVRDRHLAEDVVQDTVIAAWQRADSFRGEGSIEGWMCSIAHRTALSYLRRRKRGVVALDERRDAGTGGDLSNRVAQAAELEAAHRALDRLDELSRQIVLMREFDDRSYAEIADRVGLSVAAVRSRLLRARAALHTAVAHVEAAVLDDDSAAAPAATRSGATS